MLLYWVGVLPLAQGTDSDGSVGALRSCAGFFDPEGPIGDLNARNAPLLKGHGGPVNDSMISSTSVP